MCHESIWGKRAPSPHHAVLKDFKHIMFRQCWFNSRFCLFLPNRVCVIVNCSWLRQSVFCCWLTLLVTSIYWLEKILDKFDRSPYFHLATIYQYRQNTILSYLTPYHISYHIIAYHISYRTVPYCIIWYHIIYYIIYNIIHRTVSYRFVSYHIISYIINYIISS